MRVRLLKDVTELGGIKVTRRTGRQDVHFRAGTVVEMSEASAQKYIKAGLAAAPSEPKSTP